MRRQLFPVLFGGSAPVVDYQQWKLNDNAANTVVSGSIEGVMVGGNTADVAATLNGKAAFHLNGSSQYARVQLVSTFMRADEITHLWTDHASNPVLSAATAIQFGQLWPNPGGGWWFYGCYQNNIHRWASTDLVTWTDDTLMLSGVPGGWDAELHVVLVFQTPGGDWVMLYRGNGAGGLKIGKATSADGTNWTRINNGGVDDGLFPQFGGNYDPTAIILIDGVYYLYVNGSPDHDHTNIYTSSDLVTWTAYANNPIFDNGFCGYVFKYLDYYYMLIPRDQRLGGSTLYDHGLALYRCADQYFQYSNRQYLGYAVINNKPYNDRYLDVPTFPFTDVTRTIYAPEFGATLYTMYTGDLTGASQSLASTTFTALAALQAIPESDTETYHHTRRSFSFWVQFDSFTNGDPVFSVGSSPTDGSPVQFIKILGAPGTPVMVLYLAGGFRYTTGVLHVDTLYHIVVVDGETNTLVYVNGSLDTTIAYKSNQTDGHYLYMGTGYGGRFLDGYMQDFRTYQKALTLAEVGSLYAAGPA